MQWRECTPEPLGRTPLRELPLDLFHTPGLLLPLTAALALLLPLLLTTWLHTYLPAPTFSV